jgi:hypothetical protein
MEYNKWSKKKFQLSNISSFYLYIFLKIFLFV